jgi:hypothetical protein
MKPKQLPDGLDEWLKTRTFFIGGVSSVEANSKRSVRRANGNKKKPESASFAKTARVRKRIILVPPFESATRRPGCFAMPKSP